MPKDKATDYAEFKKKVDAFKTLFADAPKGHVELVILDLINEYSPNFMHYKALEMVEEGDFDDDVAVRGHFKRLLWDEVLEENFELSKRTAFKTDEEIIEELNKSSFLDKHPNFVPLIPGATQAMFDAQMANWGRDNLEESMCAIVEHPYPNQDL